MVILLACLLSPGVARADGENPGHSAWQKRAFEALHDSYGEDYVAQLASEFRMGAFSEYEVNEKLAALTGIDPPRPSPFFPKAPRREQGREISLHDAFELDKEAFSRSVERTFYAHVYALSIFPDLLLRAFGVAGAVRGVPYAQAPSVTPAARELVPELAPLIDAHERYQRATDVTGTILNVYHFGRGVVHLGRYGLRAAMNGWRSARVPSTIRLTEEQRIAEGTINAVYSHPSRPDRVLRLVRPELRANLGAERAAQELAHDIRGYQEMESLGGPRFFGRVKTSLGDALEVERLNGKTLHAMMDSSLTRAEVEELFQLGEQLARRGYHLFDVQGVRTATGLRLMDAGSVRFMGSPEAAMDAWTETREGIELVGQCRGQW